MGELGIWLAIIFTELSSIILASVLTLINKKKFSGEKKPFLIRYQKILN